MKIIQNLSSFSWSIAKILRGDFKQSEYGKVILPFVVLRRLDCILEPSKDTLIFDCIDEITPSLEDVLFEAGCDDALINYKNGTVFLDFDREDGNLENTIISAIKDIESANIGARIISVAPVSFSKFI